jgi:hypothetical protein
VCNRHIYIVAWGTRYIYRSSRPSFGIGIGRRPRISLPIRDVATTQTCMSEAVCSVLVHN